MPGASVPAAWSPTRVRSLGSQVPPSPVLDSRRSQCETCSLSPSRSPSFFSRRRLPRPTRLGVTGGLNLASVDVSTGELFVPDFESVARMSIGALVTMPISENLGFQLAGSYSQKGGKWDLVRAGLERRHHAEGRLFRSGGARHAAPATVR